MIPIECPKCGRGGSVPPDRLNARLVCKACHTVFHLDNTGRMVLGDPQSFDMKSTTKAHANRSARPDFNLKQTLEDIPKPVKFGVPAVLLAVFGYLYLGPGPASPSYLESAESLVKAAANNDKSKVVSYSTPDSAEAAGQWSDLVHAELEKAQVNPSTAVNPAVFSGDAEKDSDLTLLVVMTGAGTGPPVTLTLPMKKDGSSWKFDATKGLEGAAKQAASTKNKK